LLHFERRLELVMVKRMVRVSVFLCWFVAAVAERQSPSLPEDFVTVIFAGSTRFQMQCFHLVDGHDGVVMVESSEAVESFVGIKGLLDATQPGEAAVSRLMPLMRAAHEFLTQQQEQQQGGKGKAPLILRVRSADLQDHTAEALEDFYQKLRTAFSASHLVQEKEPDLTSYFQLDVATLGPAEEAVLDMVAVNFLQGAITPYNVHWETLKPVIGLHQDSVQVAAPYGDSQTLFVRSLAGIGPESVATKFAGDPLQACEFKQSAADGPGSAASCQVALGTILWPEPCNEPPCPIEGVTTPALGSEIFATGLYYDTVNAVRDVLIARASQEGDVATPLQDWPMPSLQGLQEAAQALCSISWPDLEVTEIQSRFPIEASTGLPDKMHGRDLCLRINYVIVMLVKYLGLDSEKDRIHFAINGTLVDGGNVKSLPAFGAYLAQSFPEIAAPFKNGAEQVGPGGFQKKVQSASIFSTFLMVVACCAITGFILSRYGRKEDPYRLVDQQLEFDFEKLSPGRLNTIAPNTAEVNDI